MEKQITKLENLSLKSGPYDNKCSKATMSIELMENPCWPGFKFITKKRGRHGPTKEECLNYYKDG